MTNKKKVKRKERIMINKVVTRGGDKGMTSLATGQRVSKTHPRIEAYGTVDELNAFLGKAIETSKTALGDEDFIQMLIRIQHDLFNLGAELASMPKDPSSRKPSIDTQHVAFLEESVDKYNAELPELTSFILPGGSPLAAELHICRTICRRAERLAQSIRPTEQPAGQQSEYVPEKALIYLNRLSDAFFVFSRWVLVKANLKEHLWHPFQ
ncbi:MAG: ATP:cob(I)alamin adenosyltransferase [Acidobacteria bacterium]|nr:MAG: ATP:cob(I)alamin adenosyltransferase [Acidobacteriota bacterium]